MPFEGLRVRGGSKLRSDVLRSIMPHAGVPDQEAAQGAVDFAGKVELLRKQELQKLQLAEIQLNDESSIAAALPK